MKNVLTLLFALTFFALNTYAQDEEKNPLEISGSADLYYKYDFSGYVNQDGTSNIGTSFADK